MKQITRVTTKPETCKLEVWSNFLAEFYVEIDAGLFPPVMGKGVQACLFVDLLNQTVISTIIIAEKHCNENLLSATKSLEAIHNNITTRLQ